MSRRLNCLLFLIVASAQAAPADESSNSDPDQEATRQASAARLKLMRRRVSSLKALVETSNGPEEVEVIETPLLRYSNPAAPIVTRDAAVWAWGRVGRPVALASVEAEGCELVSLSDRAVSLSGKSGLKWAPSASELKFMIVPDAPAPGESQVVRARQMKELARKFSATGHYGKGSENLELRLMDRYIHRYADPERGLVDGAIFVFAAGTNPEVLLLVECRQAEQKKRDWLYACARLSAGGLEARLGDKVVWSCAAISAWDSNAPYTAATFGPEDLAPDDPTRTP